MDISQVVNVGIFWFSLGFLPLDGPFSAVASYVLIECWMSKLRLVFLNLAVILIQIRLSPFSPLKLLILLYYKILSYHLSCLFSCILFSHLYCDRVTSLLFSLLDSENFICSFGTININLRNLVKLICRRYTAQT